MRSAPSPLTAQMEGDTAAPARMEPDDDEVESAPADQQRSRQLSATTPERDHRRRSRNSMLYESTGADKLFERDLVRKPVDPALPETADDGDSFHSTGSVDAAAVVTPDENVDAAVDAQSPAPSSGSGRSKSAASKLSINVQASNALDAPSRSPHRCVPPHRRPSSLIGVAATRAGAAGPATATRRVRCSTRRDRPACRLRPGPTRPSARSRGRDDDDISALSNLGLLQP